MSTTKEVWILGAAGRTGRAVSVALAAQNVTPVLVGRNEAALRELAGSLPGTPRVVVAASIDAMGDAMKRSGPCVVLNTIGPFAETMLAVVRASGGGTAPSHYLDLSNELTSTAALLGLHDEAVAAGRCLVSGAGFGVLGTEGLVVKLCENEPPAQRVRVDAIPFVSGGDAGGLVGPTLAATILSGLPHGISRYDEGRLVRVSFGSDAEELVLPDGSKVTVAAVPTGDLEAARRASGAPFAVAGSSMAPSGLAVRVFLPIVAAAMSWGWLLELAIRRVAAIRIPPQKGPPKPSWTRARVEWPGGRVRQGFLRTGDAMDFTVSATTEIAARLARDEGRPGAYTPAALFGADLALKAGGTFILDP